MTWQPIETVKPNVPVLVLYAHANPPYFDVAVLHYESAEDGYYHWQNCVSGWLGGEPCILDYIDEIEEPTHWMPLPQPPKHESGI